MLKIIITLVLSLLLAIPSIAKATTYNFGGFNTTGTPVWLNATNQEYNTVSLNSYVLSTACNSVFLGGNNCVEAFTTGAVIPSTSTSSNYFGIAAYYTDNAIGFNSGGTNPVGLFTYGLANANGASVWGLNPVLASTVGKTGVVLQNEFDFNPRNTTDSVVGIYFNGAATVTPSSSFVLYANALGGGHPWGTGYFFAPGCCTNALNINEASTGSTSASMPIYMEGKTSGTPHGYIMFADNSGNGVLDAASGANVILETAGTTALAAGSTGTVIGVPSFGFEGAGTLNVASGVYLNGTAYTNPDYVFDSWFSKKPVKGYSVIGLEAEESYAESHHELPDVVEFDRMGKPKAQDIFNRADKVLEKAEEAHIYLWNHEHRLQALEKEQAKLQAELKEK